MRAPPPLEKLVCCQHSDRASAFMPPPLAVDEFEADANRKPRKRPVGSKRRKPTPSKSGSMALDEGDIDGDMDHNVNFVSYDYFSDEDENAPVQQRSMEPSPLKAPVATGVAGAWSVAPFDGTDPLAALTAAAAAAARCSGLSLREAAVMHPKPTVQLAARDLSTAPPGPPCFTGAPPPHFMAALRAEAAAALAAPPPPPPLPPSLCDVEPTLSSTLPAPLPERSRHLARLDSEIGGMSVQQLKEKIRSVASTRRERLHGVAQA